jgi:hypothetical protein
MKNPVPHRKPRPNRSREGCQYWIKSTRFNFGFRVDIFRWI